MLWFNPTETFVDVWREGGAAEAVLVAMQRGVTSTLVHCGTTGTIGFFYGLAKLGVRPGPVRFGSARSHGAWMLAFGWFFAVIFHGAYNAFLMDRAEFLALLLVLPLLLLQTLLLRPLLVRQIRKDIKSGVGGRV